MAKGYNAAGDLLNKTVDGRDLNDLWADYQQVLAQWNADRQRLINLLTFPVTNNVEHVPIIGSSGDFEEASEYGVPKSIRPGVQEYAFGYDFKWYDLGARFTWQFLADAPASRVDAVQNQAIEADSRLVYTKVMKRVFNPTNNLATIDGNPFNVYTFYNGQGQAPPQYKSNVFDSSHTHFLASGAAAVDPGDLEAIIEHLVHHGYDQTLGYTLVVMANRTETSVIRQFRFGVNGATYDFIPSSNTPPGLIPVDVRLFPANAPAPPSTYQGFKVVGSYGPLLVIEEDMIPTKYLFSFASGGPDNVGNPVGFRQHANPALQGMRLVKGRTADDYPLIDSYYVRGFGTGVRHRGAGVLMQITTNSTYAPPALYA